MKAAERWLRASHRRVVHPLEIIGILSRDYEHPLQRYSFFEKAGHIIPQSFVNGEINAVRIYFPPRKYLDEIEGKYSLERGALIRKLNWLFIYDKIPTGQLRLPQKVLNELADERYVKKSDRFVRLGKEGRKFVEARN